LQDYIFSILTGYCDPPAGIAMSDEMAYNPYFPGGVIGMPQQLYPDGVEYDDGEKRVCFKQGLVQWERTHVFVADLVEVWHTIMK